MRFSVNEGQLQDFPMTSSSTLTRFQSLVFGSVFDGNNHCGLVIVARLGAIELLERLLLFRCVALVREIVASAMVNDVKKLRAGRRVISNGGVCGVEQLA